MRRILCLTLVAIMLLALPMSVSAAEIDGQAAAEKLHALGLLAGVGTNADGSVNFDTAGNLNRAQAVTQIVRFLGAEKTALAENNAHPFDDVPAWAVPYVSYAYANGITNGVSAGQFGSDAPMNDAAFLTLILRVLGYDDAVGDFAWDAPYALAKKAGLIFSDIPDRDFTRGEAFLICYRALTVAAKDGTSLADRLMAQGVFTKETFSEVTKDVPESRLYTIDELNVDSIQWSHAEDDIHSASLEINYRDTVQLGNSTVGTSLFTDCIYPRIKKVRDDLYLLTYMRGDVGSGTLYYVTSEDGVNWGAPKVLWNNKESAEGGKIKFTDGPLQEKSTSLLAVNPDACVLNNGDILVVYFMRPSIGYSEEAYQKLTGVYVKRGTVGADNTITWGKEQQISYGSGWEPMIWQRPDGRVEVYWTNASASFMTYGTGDWTCTNLVYSDDNGFTWTPNIEAGTNGAQKGYMYINVYQESMGKAAAPIKNADGTLRFPDPVPFFKGQMPSATNLYNGKTALAMEIRPIDGSFHISIATSGENGEWRSLAYGEDATKQTEAIVGAESGAAPYLGTFPSGEVYLVYNSGSYQRGRLVSPDGKTVGAEMIASPAAVGGYWGTCSIIGSHKALSAVHSNNSLFVYTSYLNHRIQAKKLDIQTDGFTNDWETGKDALFVGSESQAQATLRVAHDDENVYFLVSLLDYYLTSEDSVTVSVADTLVSDYRITVTPDGKATLDTYLLDKQQSSSVLETVAAVPVGTVDRNTDKDEGAVIEIAVPKTKLALDGKKDFAVSLALTNCDGDGYVVDTLTNVSSAYTAYWPKVVLE